MNIYFLIVSIFIFVNLPFKIGSIRISSAPGVLVDLSNGEIGGDPLTTLHSEIDSNTQCCSDQSTAVSNANDAITALQGTISTMQTQLSDLQTQFDALYLQVNPRLSDIIELDYKFRQLLNFPEGTTFEVIWKGNEDGYLSTDFLAAADGVPNTIILVESALSRTFGGYIPGVNTFDSRNMQSFPLTRNFVFGGFAPDPWMTAPCPTFTGPADAFLFSYTNNFTAPLNPIQQATAQWHCEHYLAFFGSTPDLRVLPAPDPGPDYWGNENWWQPGGGFIYPPGQCLIGDSPSCNNAGRNWFRIEKVELLKVVLPAP